MVSRSNIVVIVVISALSIMAAGIVALYLLPDEQSAEGVGVTQGHWYLVDAYVDDENGEYREYSYENNDLAGYDITIVDVVSNSFYGYCGDQNRFMISGAVNDNLCFTLDDGFNAYTASGDIIGDYLCITFMSMVTSDSGDSSVRTTMCAYTKDPARPHPTKVLRNMSSAVSGEWIVCNDAFRGSTEDAWKCQSMTIDSSISCVFSGELVINHNGKLVELYVEGTMIPYKWGYGGAFMDTQGLTWNISLSNGVLSIVSVGIYDHEVYCVTAKLSKTAGTYIPLRSSMDLAGTSWKVTSDSIMDSYGNISVAPDNIMINMTEQEGNIVVGNFANGFKSTTLFICILSDGHTIRLAWENAYGELKTGVGWISDDGLQMWSADTSISGNPASRNTMFEKVSSQSIDMIGHWYCGLVSGYDSDGNLVSMDLAHDYEIGVYDHDVLYASDNLYFGRFNKQYLSGSIIDGQIKVQYSDGKYSYSVTSWMDGSNLVMIYTMYDRGTGSTEVYQMHFSKTRDAIAIHTPDLDLVGNWTATVKETLTDYGEIHDASGSSLKIEKYRSGAFIGLMEQTSGMKMLKGVMALTPDGYMYGVALDSDGRLWNVIIESDVMIFNESDASAIESIKNDLNSTCRIYVRTAEKDVDIPVADLVGFAVTSHDYKTIDSRGNVREMDYALVFEIEYQNWNCVAGDVTMGDNEYGFVGYTYMQKGNIYIDFLVRSSTGDYYGSLIMYEDFGCISYNFLQDGIMVAGSSIVHPLEGETA